WKVTVACFAVTVVGLTETILTLIVALGGVDAAWPVTGTRVVATRMAEAATAVTRRFMVNSLFMARIVRGKIYDWDCPGQDPLSGTTSILNPTLYCEL